MDILSKATKQNPNINNESYLPLKTTIQKKVSNTQTIPWLLRSNIVSVDHHLLTFVEYLAN